MKPINVELTLGHNIGISASYYIPNENEVLEDYLTAVESLTISNDKTKLTKQIAELKQSNIYCHRSKYGENHSRQQLNTL